jgi:hypothetical protein
VITVSCDLLRVGSAFISADKVQAFSPALAARFYFCYGEQKAKMLCSARERYSQRRSSDYCGDSCGAAHCFVPVET